MKENCLGKTGTRLAVVEDVLSFFSPFVLKQFKHNNKFSETNIRVSPFNSKLGAARNEDSNIFKLDL